MSIKLFHGSYEPSAPKIKIGKFALGAADNVFDGIFASDSLCVAESHGNYVYTYEVKSIASNQDLDCDNAIEAIVN